MITHHEEYRKLAEALEMKSLFYKREDLHPYGSHKGRSIPVMIDINIEKGIRHFAISSSGNAALAAAFHIQKINEDFEKKGLEQRMVLDILVGQHITTKKLRKLEQFASNEIKITSHDRPLQTLFSITKDPLIKSLRQSDDDTSLLGYESLAEELLEIPDLKAVFIGASSGTSAQSMAQYFEKNGKQIEMHIVQTSSCHHLADAFIDFPGIDEKSIADAIVDHAAVRKNVLLELLDNNKGSAWVASNEQIKSAQEMSVKYADLEISTNSALSLAGLMQAVYTGREWNGSVVCVICGD